MAASSSATRTVALVMELFLPVRHWRILSRVGGDGHENAKCGAVGLTVAFDNAAMRANDLGDKGEAETRTVGLGRNEGIEEMRHKVLRNARAVVMHAEFQWQRNLLARSGNRQADARTVGGRQHDLAVRLVADGLRRILHEVEEDLNQLVAVGIDRRERGVVILNELDIAGKAGLRDRLHAIEHDVNVDRHPVDRALVGEDFHAIDQRHDAVCLVADKLSQRAVFLSDRGFQKLCRTANARKRVLDLMGQHGGQAADRTGGCAMRQLTIDLVRHGAFPGTRQPRPPALPEPARHRCPPACPSQGRGDERSTRYSLTGARRSRT